MIREYLNKFLRKSTGETTGLAKPSDWLKGLLGVEESWSGVEITAESSLSSSTVAACVRLLSESIASLPLHVYRRDATGKLRAPEHALYSLLHDKPNPFQTSYTWRAHMMTCVLLHGNSYSVVERDLSGRVVALWPIDPRCVLVKSNGVSMYYEVRIRGVKTDYDFNEILHIKGPSIDGVTGKSIISLAKQGIGLDLALSQHGSLYFKNNATPLSYIVHPQTLSTDAKAGILDYMTDKWGGAKNANKLGIMEEGMEIKTVSFSPEDSQFLQSRAFSVQDVCRWFKVNPHLVGDPSRLAYASSEAEFNAYLVHSLGPWLVNIQAEMNATLLADATNLIEFDPNGMARGSQVERYAAYEKGLASGFLTVADVRSAENLPFLQGTDKLPTKEVQNVAA